MANHIFISHGSENRDEANALCAYIEARGMTAWIAPRDVRPGVDYSEELQRAIETCAAFVVLVTDMANKSPYVRAETEMAFSSSKPLLPVRLADVKPAAGLAFFLKIRHWTDAYGAGRDAALERLALELKTLTGADAAPGPASAPPPLPPAPTPSVPPQPAPARPPEAALTAAAIGPNADWYQDRFHRLASRNTQLGWNWAACLAGPVWLAYRKLWLPAGAVFAVLLAALALGLLSTALLLAGLGLVAAAMLATGLLGNSLYRQHVLRLIAGTAALDRDSALAALGRRGGVSLPGAVVAALLAAAAAGGAAAIAFSPDPAPPGVRNSLSNDAAPSPDPGALTPPVVPIEGDKPPVQQQPQLPETPQTDEEALRRALEEATNALEQLPTPEVQPQAPDN